MDKDVDRRVRIITELLRKHESLASSDSHATDNNYTEKYQTIDELAEMVNLSPVHLRALFSRDMKITPRRFIKLLRMGNAAALAEEDPRLTISEITERVRGGDESHFQRDFKKTFGMTLGEFRRRHIQQSEEDKKGVGSGVGK